MPPSQSDDGDPILKLVFDKKIYVNVYICSAEITLLHCKFILESCNHLTLQYLHEKQLASSMYDPMQIELF